MTVRPPEFDFLLKCLRRSLRNLKTPPRPLTGSLLPLPKHLDWSTLLALAEENKVTAIVYPILAPMAPEQFASAWRTGWLRAELLAAELESILDAFSERGIDVIPLKGPVLAEELYGDRTARLSGDLDLLVRSEQFGTAKALLLDLGFTAEPPRRNDYHQVFLKLGTMVELHWSLGRTGHCPLDTEEIWRNSTIGAFHGRALRTMDEEDLILYLGYHMLKEYCLKLLWTADLSRAFARVESNGSWEALIEYAQSRGLSHLLLCTCLVLQEVLGGPLPAELAVADTEQPEMRREVRRFFEVQSAGDAAPILFPEIWRPTAHLGPGAWLKWRGFTRFLPTQRDRVWAKSRGIPGPLSVLLFPVLRPIRVLRKYGFVRVCQSLFYSLRG